MYSRAGASGGTRRRLAGETPALRRECESGDVVDGATALVGSVGCLQAGRLRYGSACDSGMAVEKERALVGSGGCLPAGRRRYVLGHRLVWGEGVALRAVHAGGTPAPR